MTSLAKINWQAKLLEAVPLLIGVAITRQFNLHGWRAILVYILAASTTREVIDQLEPETFSLLSGPVDIAQNSNGNKPSPQADQITLPVRVAPSAFQVVHTIPGRLRLRIPTLAENPYYARQLRQRLESDERIQTLRLNPAAASVTVKYDVDRFTEADIHTCLSELVEPMAGVASNNV